MSRTVIDRDKGYRRIMARLASTHSVSVKVGVRAAETEAAEGGTDLVDIAMFNEFGTSRIPERSFLRSTMDENRAKFGKLLEGAVIQMIDGTPPLLAYGRVGMVATGDVQRKIRNHVPPPNAPSTIAKKGSSTPLIDTGRLRQSIDYTIEGL